MNRKKLSNILTRYFYSVPITSYIAALMIVSSFMMEDAQRIHILIASSVIGGYEVIYNSVMAIMKKRPVSSDWFALISVIGTFCLGLCAEAAVGMTVFALCRNVYRGELEYENAKLEFRREHVFNEDVRKKLDSMEKTPSDTEKRVRRASVIFSAVCIVGIVILSVIVPLLWRVSVAVWLRRAFILLASVCPACIKLCASIEAARAVDESAGKGIFFKSRKALEAASKVTSVVFSRIESVSSSRYEIAEIVPSGIDSRELLTLAAFACAFSPDPAAVSLTEESGIAVDPAKVDMYKVLPELGAAVILGGIKVAAGNEKFMSVLDIKCFETVGEGVYIHVCAGRKYAGYVKLAEPKKPADAAGVDELHRCGVDRVILISEESDEKAGNIAKKLGIDEVWSELSPNELPQKMKSLREMQLEGEFMAYVGSGTWDSEIMAQSDVGVCIGRGYKCSDSDIYITGGSCLKISEALGCAKKMMHSIRRNLIITGIVKIAAIVLAISGFSSIWLTAILDTAALSAVFNFSEAKSKTDIV